MYRFELPPDNIARPLPVTKPTYKAVSNGRLARRAAAKHKRSNKNDADDTPRAFLHLMAFSKGFKPPPGLDDGIPPAKRQRLDGGKPRTPSVRETRTIPAAIPKIMPGERMADYSARVDAALPVGGLINKGRGKDLPNVKKPQTRMEKRLQKMQKEWREVDARWRKKLADAREDANEAEDLTGSMALNPRQIKKKSRKGNNGDDEDPWVVVGNSRKEHTSGLVGLHDVVQAPPQLKAPKEKFKVLNGTKVNVANIPSASGSLHRREALGEARETIVEKYRELMAAKRKAL